MEEKNPTLLQKLEEKVNQLSEKVFGSKETPAETPAPEPTPEEKYAELESQFSALQEENSKLKTQLQEKEQIQEKFKTQFDELQEEIRKLGEKDAGSDAPAPAADQDPPGHGGSDEDPFAAEHSYAEKKFAQRQARQGHK